MIIENELESLRAEKELKIKMDEILRNVEALICDIRINDPEYKFIWDLENAPGMRELAKITGKSSFTEFVMITRNGFKFDLLKIKQAQGELLNQRKEFSFRFKQ